MREKPEDIRKFIERWEELGPNSENSQILDSIISLISCVTLNIPVPLSGPLCLLL